MKAISLWQPWASLMAIGAKKIEARTWSTNYRGPLAIHASKTLVLPKFRKALDDLKIEPDRLPRGFVLGVCQLILVCKISNSIVHNWLESIFGDYTPGRYAWLTGDMVRFEIPVPCRGKQGLWNWQPGPAAAAEKRKYKKN